MLLYLFLAERPVLPGKYVLTIFVQTLPCSLTAFRRSASPSGVQVVLSIAGFKVSVQRLAHWSLFLLCTIAATIDHLVPHCSIALTSLASSSGDHPPLTTSEAILANQRLRQSLFVRSGTCLAIAYHLDGLALLGSSFLTASRSRRSSSSVQDRLSRVAEPLSMLEGFRVPVYSWLGCWRLDQTNPVTCCFPDPSGP